MGNHPPLSFMIALASVYLDEEMLQKHLIQYIPDSITERHFIQGTRPSNMAALYNRVLVSAKSRYVIFAHPDVSFSEEVCSLLVSELKGDVGVTGLVGVSGPGKYVWANSIQESQEVLSLDSCLMAVDREHGIHFDEGTFNELHLYCEDYCYAARSKGLRCLVVPAKQFWHESTTLKKDGACWGNYMGFHKLLMSKWKWRFGNDVVTT